MATVHLIVSALLRQDGRVLLVQEIGPGDTEPTWMLPGGQVEPGESVMEALRRELCEETGLELIGVPPLAFAVDVIDAADQYLALTFRCEATGVLAPDDPDGYILGAAWVDEQEALSRLALVDWYDTGPLRRHLADGRTMEIAVVDRR